MLTYAWLMLLFPAIGALVISLFGVRLGRRVVSVFAPAMVGLSFLVAVWMFVVLLGLPADRRTQSVILWQWMSAGTFHVEIGLWIDQLAITMAMVVTGISFLIHIYSAGYMAHDEYVPRFFAYMNFFVLMMLTLVLANNYLLLFVGWEGVGLASYLLIGFYFQRPAAADAGKKAFLVNRIGDFGLLVAMFLIWTNLGSLRFSDVFPRAQSVLAGGSNGVAIAITMLMLLACTGKSAQLPLFVWLPDAMEGPTPVSALIHAATMVTAGVYLVARSHVLFDLAPLTQNWVAWVGVITALFAATIALTITDLKRILAYSTISQLGYMFLAVGVGAYGSGIFHLMTHAFFKALLFLAAGSVMHALAGELDIRKMGNLRAKMPTTYLTFLIGAAALAGIPLLSGFFSKDEILYQAFLKSPVLWLVGLVTAALTAIYSFRAVFVPFWGEERDRKLFNHAHESPSLMTIPLVILAVGAVLAGYLGLPHLSLIESWLGPVFGAGEHAAGSPVVEWVLLGVSALVALGGVYFAYVAYVANPALPRRVREGLGGLFRLVEAKYYIDWFYSQFIMEFVRPLAEWLAASFDKVGIDGAVNGIAWITGQAGAAVRRLQTGYVGLYALSILFGTVLVLALLALLGVR
ncbi:MAG TPA: NADH-quinone oxidoreductase subunit L [Anaerolineae bacterium]